MIRDLIKNIKLLWANRQLILGMARREVTMQYAGSLLGAVWTFIHPLVLISVFWFVFSVGFKTRPMNNVPFVVWLTAGMMPWFLFADIMTGSVGIVVAHTNLIKKTLFPAQILPVVKIVSALVTHAIFLILLLLLLIFQGIPITWYFLQFFYYCLCLCLFSLGLGWMCSALNVFIRDVTHIVGVGIQVGFWITPIFWDLRIMPPKVQFLLKLNPIYYIVQGYRDSFIYKTGFWCHPLQTLYFWTVCLITLACGMYIFERLKPQFADVL